MPRDNTGYVPGESGAAESRSRGDFAAMRGDRAGTIGTGSGAGEMVGRRSARSLVAHGKLLPGRVRAIGGAGEIRQPGGCRQQLRRDQYLDCLYSEVRVIRVRDSIHRVQQVPAERGSGDDHWKSYYPGAKF